MKSVFVRSRDRLSERIEYLSQFSMSRTPVQEYSTEDDVEENVAADYAPKTDL